MVQNHDRNEQDTALKPVNMLVWRLNRREEEKREESVNRDILRRIKH